MVATSQASASHLKDGNDYLASCWNLIGNLIIQIHQELLTALFVCLSWLVAMNIQALTEDVATVEDVSSFCLIKWKRNYFAILECVREIDRFCGPAMTVMFVKVFVQTTISVFAATEVAFGNVSPPAGLLVMTVINVVSVSALMVGISRINEKVASWLHIFDAIRLIGLSTLDWFVSGGRIGWRIVQMPIRWWHYRS